MKYNSVVKVYNVEIRKRINKNHFIVSASLIHKKPKPPVIITETDRGGGSDEGAKSKGPKVPQIPAWFKYWVETQYKPDMAEIRDVFKRNNLH